MTEDADAQDDELIALESIFSDSFHSFSKNNSDEDGLTKNKLKGGEIKISIELPKPFYICFTNSINGELEKLEVEHLPPVFLAFYFPERYPSSLPPEFTLCCKWLDCAQLSMICHQLDSLWSQNSGNEIMFTWAQFVKEETLNLLNITDSLVVNCNRSRRRRSSENIHLAENNLLGKGYGGENSAMGLENVSVCGAICSDRRDDPRATQDISPTTNLLRIIREYNEDMCKKVFDTKVFCCKVCFCDKVGINCLEFWPCQHVFCKDCMKSYFEVQINDGNVKHLKCPEEKCNSEANPKQVESLVSFDLYHKWDIMLLNSTLSSLGDIQPCPRQHCQYPVTIEDSQGQCPSCGFVFCGLCRFGWHGLEKCKFKSGEAKKILESYMKGSEEEKQQLEDRFGKKYLSVMVDEYLSANYMNDNAKDCPRCRAHIEKIEGCNKMTCRRCDTNFCWLCEKFLDRVNPYSHFNNPGSACFNMLFHGIEDDFENEFLDDDDDL